MCDGCMLSVCVKGNLESELLTKLKQSIFGRNYDAESERQKGVEEFYRLQHIKQTYDFVSKVYFPQTCIYTLQAIS